MEDKEQFIPAANGTLQFQEGNEIRYSHNFSFERGVPSGVDFYPEKEFNELIAFVADGYGILKRHNLPGKYGNGSIYIPIKEIPGLLDYCRANFLNKK